MYHPNFCAECGERLARKRRRVWSSARFCDDCARRIAKAGMVRPLLAVSLIAISTFALGRYLRPAPPPLIIQRAADSPLSDLPVNLNDAARTTNRKESYPANQNAAGSESDDEAYICGARTKKGTPCHRRVHVPGERCFQHRGMPAMVPLEKLTIKP